MSWLKNAVMYQIFIDRFAGYDEKKDWHKPDFMGGNLRGIIDKFPYIKSLGVNTVWLSPFYKASAFHGYEITDFNSVDEHFGTEKDLQDLITLTHDNDMKIIADIVPNHVSALHPYFLDAKKNPNSKYRDWFIFKKWPNEYIGFLTFQNMAKLNLDNPEAMNHILESARKWLRMGLDGYRIDHIIGLSNKNVAELFGTLKEEFPDCIFLGEATMFGLGGDPASTRSDRKGLSTVRIPRKRRIWLLKHVGARMMIRNYVGILDGMLDFYFAHQIVRYARATSEARRKSIEKRIRLHVDKFPEDFSLVLFLDNHDLTRYLFQAKEDTEKLLSAARLQFSLKGAKVIYYGTEVGVTQEKSFLDSAPIHDIQARMPMPWNVAQQNTKLLEAYMDIIAGRS